MNRRGFFSLIAGGFAAPSLPVGSTHLITTPVITIAHYMQASRQILDDAPCLQSEINRRLENGRLMLCGDENDD